MDYDTTAKIITVNSEAANTDDTFQITYPTAPQRAKGVFADVEIHYNGSLPKIADGPREFQVTFKAKRARWKYYVITDRTNATFRIEDKAVPPLKFSDEMQPDASDDVAKSLAEQYPTMQRLRFVSDELIPCRQEARKSIQLLRLDGGQVVEALPNPSLRNYTIWTSRCDYGVLGC